MTVHPSETWPRNQTVLPQHNAQEISLSQREAQPHNVGCVLRRTEPKNTTGEFLGQESGQKIPKALWEDEKEPGWLDRGITGSNWHIT